MAVKKEDKFEKIRENYTWVIAISTSLSVIVLNFFKFIEYLTAKIYFNYYSLDINLYKYNDSSFIYGLCLSFVFMLASFSLFYCFYQLGKNIKAKIFLKNENLMYLFIIILVNLYIIFLFNLYQNLLLLVVCIFILIFSEILSTIFIFWDAKINNKSKKELKKYILNHVMFLPFLMVILIILHCFRTSISLKMQNYYRVIDNQKVIVYTDDEYYLTLDCEINNNELIIYKGTQEKIDNNNVYSIYKNFETVKIEYNND